jgi:hypothetical protein
VGEKAAADVQQRSSALIRTAHELLSLNRPAEAEELMAVAWQLESAAGFKDAYEIRCDLGLITAEIGKWRAAAAHLTYCMQHATPEKKAKEPRLEEAWAADLAKAKAEIVTLWIEVDVRGAAVKVNGEAAGVSPLPGEVFAEPGQVTVAVTAAGYKPGSLSLTGAKGQAVNVRLELVKDPDAASSGRPRLQPSAPSTPSTPKPRSPVPLFVSAGLTVAAAAVGAGMFIAAGTADAYGQRTAKGLNEVGGERACLDAIYRERCSALLGAADEVLVTRVVGIGALAIATGAGAWMTYELVKSGQFGALGAKPKADKRGGRAAPKPSVSGGVMVLPGGGGVGLRGRF